MYPMRSSSSSVGLRQPRWAQSWLTDDDNQDEDLALFHDMKTNESNSFLNFAHDEIEGSYQSRNPGNFGASPSVTPPWKRNDLLAPDAEKNDYDWLLTPPGTPLFPYLDKEPTLEDVEQISLTPTHYAIRTSRVSTSEDMEQISLTPTHYAIRTSRLSRTNTREMQPNRTPRRSPGPHTPSASSSISSSSSSFMRGKTPSPSRVASSPTPRSATPTKTSKSMTTTINRASMRSSPPILQRINTSPNVRSSSTERNFPTPKQRTRGTSLSPKPHTWQSPDLGLSEEPPPNLRTCIPDRALSSSRGSMLSLRPRHSLSEMQGQHSSSSGSRVSSTTASQDYWSSKGSVISSSDDGTDITEAAFIDFNIVSPHSTPKGSKPANERKFDHEVTGRHHSHSTQRRRSISSTETSGFFHSAGRKSLEPSTRRVDHHHISQNMFRPLLSSAPTTFYTEHHRESPLAASSNASSEKGVRIFPGNESSDEEGSVISRINSNRTNQLSLEGIKVHSHADKFEVESGTDGISSTTGTAHISEMEENRGEFHESELEKLVATNLNNHKSPTIKDDKSFPIKLPTTDQKYDDLTELGLTTSTVPSNGHHDEITDKTFIDIEEDNSMTDNPSIKYQTSSSSDLGELGLLAASYNQEILPESTKQPTEIQCTCFSQNENATPTILNDNQQTQVIIHEENDQHENELVGSIDTLQRNDSAYCKELDDGLQTMKVHITSISCEDTSKSAIIQEHSIAESPSKIVRHAYITGTDSCISDVPLNDVDTWDEARCSRPTSPKHRSSLSMAESGLQHEDGFVDHIEDAIQLNHGLNPENFSLENEVKNNGIQYQQLLKDDVDNSVNLSDKSFDGKDPVSLMNGKDYQEATNLQRTGCHEESVHEDIGKTMQTDTSSLEQTEIKNFEMDVVQATEDIESRPDTMETEKVKDVQEDTLQRPVNPMEILDVLDDAYPKKPTENAHLSMDVHPKPGISETTDVTALKDVHPIPGTINVNAEEVNNTRDDENDASVCIQTETLDDHQHVQTNDLATTANPNLKASAYNFSLEETTNKILFCSSIVHEIVYKAANIAADKEAKSLTMMEPIFHQERKQFHNTDNKSSLRGKISKPGTWRGRHKENKTQSKPLQKDEVDNVPEPVIQDPDTIDEMKRNYENGVDAKTSPHTSKEKGQARFAANTNCQCSIM